LVISILQYTLKREKKFIFVPSVAWPLIMLGIVVVITARLTGGIGLRSFGAEVYGGKRYFYIMAAIAAYFAITSRRVEPRHALLYVTLFFLGSATQAIGNLAGSIHPAFNFLFVIFPVENLADLSTEFVGSTALIMRSGGLTALSLGVFCALLVRFKLAELFSFRNPLKLLVLLSTIFIGLLGGFRALLVQFLLILAILFYLEGLFRSRLLPVFTLSAILGVSLLGGFATRLPLSVQRTMAFLPIDIDPEVRMDAQYSSEWRIKMWMDVIPEIPNYLLLGKGYAMSSQEADVARMNLRQSTESSELAGDYHNGPLSVIIPLGIFGTIAFTWFLISGLRLTYENYKFGDPSLQGANMFLFAYFVAKVIFFMFIFGSLYVDLPMFAGLLGLSVTLNGGVAKRGAPTETEADTPSPAFRSEAARISPSLMGPRRTNFPSHR